MSDNTNGSANVDRSLFVKVPFSGKLSYCLLNIACCFTWGMASSYLSIFYTDTFLIPAAAVSVLFLVARIWDAINDPIIGRLADRTRSKSGRYVPWIRRWGIPLAAVTVLTFSAHPEWAYPAKIVYMFITYGILVLMYTCVNVPLNAMMGVMSQDPQQRSSLSSYLITGAVAGSLIGTLLMSYVFPIIAEAFTPARGYQIITGVLGVVAIVIFFVCSRMTKEVIIPTEVQYTQKVPISRMLKTILTDKNSLIAVLGQLVNGFLSYGRTSVFAYYFLYNMGDASLLGIWIMCIMIPQLFGTFTAQYVSNAFKSKGRVQVLGCMMYGAILLLEWFLVPVFGFGFLCWTTCIAGYFQGWVSSMTWGIIPDVVEVGELKTGIRMDAFYQAFGGFMNKLGMAIGSAGAVAFMAAAGYVANQAQTAPVLDVISAFMYGVPAIMSIAMGIMYLFYDLHYNKFDEVLAKLQEKKVASGE